MTAVSTGLRRLPDRHPLQTGAEAGENLNLGNNMLDVEFLRRHGEIRQPTVFAASARSLSDEFPVAAGQAGPGGLRKRRALDWSMASRPRNCA